MIGYTQAFGTANAETFGSGSVRPVHLEATDNGIFVQRPSTSVFQTDNAGSNPAYPSGVLYKE